MGLFALQREQEDRRRQLVVRNGSAATVNKREDSAFKQVGDSQNGETSICSTPYLPEEIWRHIHSLMSMRDAARAACLSHAFLRSWRCHPKLTLDYNTLVPMGCFGNYSGKIDSILRNHSGVGLKTLQLCLDDDSTTFPYVDGWLQIAVTPGVEELILVLHKKYNFPCSLLSGGVENSIRYIRLHSCVFRPKVEAGPLRSLTSLHLQSVCITGDELECFLSNSLALEKLDIFSCDEIIFLKIPGVLQQFSSLSVESCWNLQGIESKAPNLSYIALHSHGIKFSVGNASQMKDLDMTRANIVRYARAELPSMMPNLERLTLWSNEEVVNTPMLPTKFLYLKHLTISLISSRAFSPSYDYFSLVSFLDACPSLETLFLDVSQKLMEHESVFGGSPLRQRTESRLDFLKSVKIVGFSTAKGLVELTCYIVKNAVSLEHLVLDTLCVFGTRCSNKNIRPCRPMSKTLLEEAFRTVTAIRTYIKDEVPPAAKLTVVEPCARCYSLG
ncbi:hypothetical protein ACP4OV_018319 [Aristida adscensionis]